MNETFEIKIISDLTVQISLIVFILLYDESYIVYICYMLFH